MMAMVNVRASQCGMRRRPKMRIVMVRWQHVVVWKILLGLQVSVYQELQKERRCGGKMDITILQSRKTGFGIFDNVYGL